MEFDGHVAIVTGAGNGIGAEISRKLSAAGAHVVLADIDEGAAQSVAAQLKSATVVAADVSVHADVKRIVEVAYETYGRIDILINNALSCSPSSFLEMTPEELRKEFAVNFDGGFWAIQEVIPHMMRQQRGAIVNISSINSLSFYGNDAYSASKAAMNSLTSSIAIQFAPYGIRCNAIAPGTIATRNWPKRRVEEPEKYQEMVDRYPLGRLGEPEDIAESALFLCSEKSGWITGIVLRVDGGILLGDMDMANQITLGFQREHMTERVSDDR